VNDDWRSVEFEKLLWRIGAHASAETCSREYGGYAAHFRRDPPGHEKRWGRKLQSVPQAGVSGESRSVDCARLPQDATLNARALVGVGVGKDEAPATIESRRLLQTRTAIYAGR